MYLMIYQVWLREQNLKDWCINIYFYSGSKSQDKFLKISMVMSVHSFWTIVGAIKPLKIIRKIFQPNSTNLYQLRDSFVLKKIKERWCQLWDDEKEKLLEITEWICVLNFEKLFNPDKRYCLQLEYRVVKDVHQMTDQNDLSYDRNPMIRWGFSLDLNEK